MASREVITSLLNNQPHGIRIGCSRYSSPDVVNTPFHHLSRLQQVEQIDAMLVSGIDIRDLQIDLYLVCHQPTFRVWESFGLPMLTVEELEAFMADTGSSTEVDTDTETDFDDLEEA